MSLHTQKDHYAAIEDVHVNLENRNHAFDEYGYGPLNPKEPSDDFWKKKAEVFKTTVEEAKKSRCGNCAAFNQSKEIMKRIADGLGPAGKIVAEKADLGFCEMFKFKCAAERTCDAWLVNGPIMEEAKKNSIWKYNSRSGMWDHQRNVEHDTKDQWLGIYKKDEPNAHFHVSSKKPKHNPLNEGEGWWDSVSAFGRQAADTATLGGYKYARAGVDYAAKNAASALGYGKGTTYDKEIKQEKEKLAHDEKEHQQASSAGKLVGYGAGALAHRVPGAASALSAGEKAAKVPYYLGLAKRAVGLEEEIANVTGSAIPGSGDTGEAFRPMRRMARRGKFMNMETFIVSSSTFNSLRESKKKGMHWKRYLEEDDAYHDLREYAKRKRKGPIIVEDENTGACMYVRYGDIK